MPYTLKITAKSKTVDVPAKMPLLWVLRDVLNMKGTKFGCGIGACGACTVQLNGTAVRACQPQVSAAGTREVKTIEGLSPDGAHPLQKAWLSLDVPQCGYCQAGQIMNAAALLARTPKPSDADIDSAMTGNICRCGTYVRIREAIHLAANGGREGEEGAMKNLKKLDRRSFINFTALAGGGLMVGVYAEPEIFSQQRGGAAAPAPVNPNVYITVNPDNTFTVIAKNPETGQGMRNALPMLIADELDVDWKQVKVRQADCNPTLYGQQIEGGSTAIPTNYMPMRQIGAAARMMMVSTAAKQWNVPESECTTGSGTVKHASTNKTATYASLADAAMKMPAMAVTDIKLKDPKDFKILGTRVQGVDN